MLRTKPVHGVGSFARRMKRVWVKNRTRRRETSVVLRQHEKKKRWPGKAFRLCSEYLSRPTYPANLIWCASIYRTILLMIIKEQCTEVRLRLGLCGVMLCNAILRHQSGVITISMHMSFQILYLQVHHSRTQTMLRISCLRADAGLPTKIIHLGIW